MTLRTNRARRRAATSCLLLASLASVLLPAGASAAPTAAEPTSMQRIVPAPAVVQPNPAATYQVGPGTVVFTSWRSPDALQIGQQLAGVLRPSTGYLIPVIPVPPVDRPLPGISLTLGGADPQVGDEGYQLDVTDRSVVIRANKPAGLFAGVQSLRQLLPGAVEARSRQAGPWTVPGGRIVDYPRYQHRGAMLDVARHFLTVKDVQRYIDQITLYKINYLHLHLTDEQGWRIEIPGWPKLTQIGGSTQVGGGPAGYYTTADYRAILEYARKRYLTVVPEIDGPAHSNAALASYAELNCDGKAQPLFTGVGPAPNGTLCINKPITYKFLDDVIGRIAELTPGPYVDVGGDESISTTPADYATYMHQVEQIVAKHGKRLMGWGAALTVTNPATSTGQFWIYDGTEDKLAQTTHEGATVVMSPCVFSYLDMKYTPTVPADPLGLRWAGYIEVQTAYSWDPTWVLPGVLDSAVLGVETPLWTETVSSVADVDFMAFPRLPAIAEIGWSPLATHDWAGFSGRLAAQGPRWDAMRVNYYRSPQIPWPAGAR
ncbi:family 20 glycosylhydrolase [Actinocrispum wychmicini]|uniref:beta-N-acetylhexosaminidase n=1 Tax=Actinocrispum wychmicini TaxID=1213861 RepID=A0A4V2S7H7_9PSEU|nr:family 20 glycosylhydrolase [Actinocrispum wychmicini]TCO59910.1 hexosaminidase [Actinocrispum wychmicini]